MNFCLSLPRKLFRFLTGQTGNVGRFEPLALKRDKPNLAAPSRMELTQLGKVGRIIVSTILTFLVWGIITGKPLWIAAGPGGELMSMKKEQLDFTNATVWIPDSKTPNGVAEVPLTPLALEAFHDQMRLSPCSPYLFPDENPSGHQRTLKSAWHATLRRAQVPYFRIYDLRSTYATRLSAGGVADEWVTQMLRQGNAQVFKKYSQMKLQMKREALEKLNRRANETPAEKAGAHFGTVTVQ